MIENSTDSIPQFIAIEGVIGVGKTSLAHLLSDRIGASLLLEEGADNPFLADFYKNRSQYAFATQMFFLLSRYQQQQNLLSRDLFSERVIADYIFDKDHLFASVNLSDREFRLYDKVASALKRDIARPDLVIYLQASTLVLLRRIAKRNTTVEKGIDREYIQELNDAYNEYFFHYTDAPLLVVKTDEIDFVKNVQHLDDLVVQIRKPHTKTTYYVPAGDLDGRVV